MIKSIHRNRLSAEVSIRPRFINVLALAILCLGFSGLGTAQVTQDFNDFGFGNDAEPITYDGKFYVDSDSGFAQLVVDATLAPEWQTYSTTQPKGGVEPTVFTVKPSEDIFGVGAFKSDPPPSIKFEEAFGVNKEYYEFGVQWTAPFQIKDTVTPEDLVVRVNVRGQACKISCIQTNENLKLKFAGYKKLPYAKEYRAAGSHVKFRAWLDPLEIKPGETTTFVIEGEPDEDWHLYPYSEKPIANVAFKPTLIHFSDIGDWEIVSIKPSNEPVEKADGEETVAYHKGTTNWAIEIRAPEDMPLGKHTLKGVMGYQVCKDQCDRPKGAQFQFDISVGESRATELTNVTLTGGIDYGSVESMIDSKDSVAAKKPVGSSYSAAEIAEMASLYDPESKINYETISEAKGGGKSSGSKGEMTFLTALFGAFVGGMLLNLMPCVFPVLGLKVIGFVEQAGSDPFKIKLHGIAFSAGLIFSMWVLAGIILFIKLGMGHEVNWGAQMGNAYFVGGIVIMLFVLGLNLVGVFEMGLFMTRVGGTGEAKKGYTGSFFSGIITTLVATPCSGPFLGAAMGFALAQTAGVAMFLFTVFGLGIAAPYLVLSFFPSLINMMPRPGAWMETFKKLMGFTMFAAAAFFVSSFGAQTGVDGLSWFLMAICVISLAAFFYGKWSGAYVKPKNRYLWGWAIPLIVAGIGIWMYVQAAQFVAPQEMTDNRWVPGKVEKLLSEKKIVWVDYTADW